MNEKLGGCIPVNARQEQLNEKAENIFSTLRDVESLTENIKSKLFGASVYTEPELDQPISLEERLDSIKRLVLEISDTLEYIQEKV